MREDRHSIKVQNKLKKTSSYKKCGHNKATKYQRYRDMFGMEPNEYVALIEHQEGRCDICGKLGSLDLDHDHKDETVRGLLCRSCNLLLGIAKDNIYILENAIEYLKIPKMERYLYRE